VRLARPLPERRFHRRPDQRARTRRRRLSVRSPILRTAFPSPVTATPLDASVPGSMFPACPFESRPVSLRPVRPFGSTTPAGSPQPRPLPRLKPVSGHPPDSARSSRRLDSPLGFFAPQDQRVNAGPPCGPANRPRPIPHRSPPPSPCELPAADHRSGIATLPEACSSCLSLTGQRCRF
jgi:hypothetical protein